MTLRGTSEPRAVPPRQPNRARSQLDPRPPPSRTRSANSLHLSPSLYFMPSSPIEAHPRKDNALIRPRTAKLSPSQHGDVPNTQAASGTQDVLPNLPSESLTHITSSLDPPDLFALAQTCKQLSAHVADDHTWRRAFAYQYLGITPESDLHGGTGSKTLMLRREAGSWRKEFILRYNLRRYVIIVWVWGKVFARAGRTQSGVLYGGWQQRL